MDCNPAIAEEYLALPACKRLFTTIYGYVMEVATKEETNETFVYYVRSRIERTEFGESAKEEVVEVSQCGCEGRTSRTQPGGPADNDHVLQLLKSCILRPHSIYSVNGHHGWCRVDALEGRG